MASLPPVPYNTSLSDSQGKMSVPWIAWFRQLFLRVGANNGTLLQNPMTGIGDLIYGGDSSGTATRLPGDTSNTRKFLREKSTGGTPAAPVWDTLQSSDIPTLSYVTSVALTAPAFLTVAGSPITSSGTLALTLSGSALPLGSGGTGVTSVTTAPTASSFAGWDANSNMSANAFIPGFTSTATGGTTTTLTIAATQIQIWTGSTTQTVKLPTTGVVAGAQYFFVNKSSGVVTVQSSGANTIQAMAASSFATFTALVATPTTAANWNVSYSTSASGTVTSVAMGSVNGLSFTGGPITTSGTLTPVLTVPTTQILSYYSSGTITGKVTSGSPTVTSVSSFTGLYVGLAISGTDIAGGAYITGLNSGASTLTMSANATGGSATTVTITPSSTSGTYILPSNPSPLYIKRTIVGAGGGGGGSGTTQNNGSQGGGTTFGSTTSAGGGGGNGTGSAGPNTPGGVSSGLTTDLQITGGGGLPSGGNIIQACGGAGGTTPLGGAGIGGSAGGTGSTGGAGQNNTGAGGGGGGGAASFQGSQGGAAGGYCSGFITSLSSTYTFTIGAGGTAGGAGTGGYAGGTGGSGVVLVEEFYQ